MELECRYIRPARRAASARTASRREAGYKRKHGSKSPPGSHALRVRSPQLELREHRERGNKEVWQTRHVAAIGCGPCEQVAVDKRNQNLDPCCEVAGRRDDLATAHAHLLTILLHVGGDRIVPLVAEGPQKQSHCGASAVLRRT